MQCVLYIYLGRSFSSHEIEDRQFFCFPSQCMADWEAREVASPDIYDGQNSVFIMINLWILSFVMKQLTRSRPKRAHVF